MAEVIDAVLLDVGGILLLPHPDIVLAALAEHGASGGDAEVRRGHYAGIAAMDRLGRPSWSSYYTAMARTVGVGDGQLAGAIAALRSIYDSTDTWTLVTDGAVETLAALRAAGLKIAIVSNSDGTIADRLRASAVCQLGPGPGVSVDVVLDSGVVGVEKPDRRIFDRAVGDLGVERSKVVHVGDTRYADIVGALGAGIRPLHLDPYGDCPQPDGHEHVPDLAALLAEVVG